MNTDRLTGLPQDALADPGLLSSLGEFEPTDATLRNELIRFIAAAPPVMLRQVLWVLDFLREARWELKAMIVMLHNSELSRAQVAEILGCSERTLDPDRSPFLGQLEELLEEDGDPLRGYKKSDGNVEAWSSWKPGCRIRKKRE